MLFRYPGGKGKVAQVITNRLANFFTSHTDYEYREPFFGAGGIGFELLKDDDLVRIWFNDVDPSIGAVWNSIAHSTDGAQYLKSKVEAFTPSTEKFAEFKEFLLGISSPQDLNNHCIFDVALKKIACHQMSYSGLGTKAGGPIGGILQKSDYGVGCRYSVKTLCKNIDKVDRLISERSWRRGFCTCLDFEEVVLEDASRAFIYLDPPYYEKGPELYQFSFTEDDHRRLADALRRTPHPWLLSYDSHPEVLRLYEGWTDIDQLDFTYTINAHKGGVKKRELLISSKNFSPEGHLS